MFHWRRLDVNCWMLLLLYTSFERPTIDSIRALFRAESFCCVLSALLHKALKLFTNFLFTLLLFFSFDISSCSSYDWWMFPTRWTFDWKVELCGRKWVKFSKFINTRLEGDCKSDGTKTWSFQWNSLESVEDIEGWILNVQWMLAAIWKPAKIWEIIWV